MQCFVLLYCTKLQCSFNKQQTTKSNLFCCITWILSFLKLISCNLCCQLRMILLKWIAVISFDNIFLVASIISFRFPWLPWPLSTRQMLQINFQKCLKIPTSRLDEFIFKLNLKLKVIEKNVKDKPCMYYASLSLFNKSWWNIELVQNNLTNPNLTKHLLSKLEALIF